MLGSKPSFIASALLGLCLLHGPALHAEDLADVYRLATEADPQLAAAHAKLQATLQGRPQAKSALLPQINASAGVESHDQRYDDVPPARSPFFNDTTFTRKRYGLRLDQSLYDRQSWLRLAQADSRIAQARAEFEAARQALIVRTAEAYFNVLAAQDNLEFAKAEKAAIAHQLEQTRERFEVGLLPVTDVRESEAKYDLATAQEIDAENRLDVARENLRVIIGRLPDSLAPLKDDFPLAVPEPQDIDAWVKTALENSLALRAARYAVETARQEVKRRRAGRLPTLALSAEHGVQDDSGGFSEGKATDTVVGLALQVPLYTGGRISAQVAEARSLLTQAERQLDRQKRETIRQTRASYLNVLAGISRVKALRQALASTRTAHEAVEAGYEVGTRTAVDVLLALRDTYRARRDYSRARYDYILSTFRLKQAAGTLTVSDLKKINDWL